MKEKQFNLLQEPWIRVISSNAKVSEVSLIELFENAQLYQDLAGEIPMQNVAVLRFLVAVLSTVLLRYDKNGAEKRLTDPDDVLDYYEAIWKDHALPVNAIKQYLHQWEEHFWLVHPETPFYQISHRFSAEIKTRCGAAKLNGEMFESNNQVQLFSSRSGSEKDELTYAEAARWLLFINAFDDCAAKNPSPKECWPSKLGITIAKGKDFLETLLLNCPLLTRNNECWPENRPFWENTTLMNYDLKEVKQIPQPSGLAELYSIRSRRVCLEISERDTVLGYKETAGVTFEGNNFFGEPMTPWRLVVAKKNEPEHYVPQKYDVSKKIWQEFPTFFSIDDNKCSPGVVHWINLLQQEDIGILKKNHPIKFEVCSVYYGSMSCKIASEVHDSIIFYAGLIDRANTIRQKLIQEMIQLTEQGAKELGKLAERVAFAAGGESAAGGEKAKEDFYFRVDDHFRDWVYNTVQNDMVSVEEARSLWRAKAKKIALSCGNDIINTAGMVAFVGREKGNDKKVHYSVPEAFSAFVRQINILFFEGGKDDA